MEDMAAMLNGVAGGLQQSFGLVFERVGESLTQSAQMMQMMNEMMEAALMQNLSVEYTLRANGNNTNERGANTHTLALVIENRSQIVLVEAVVVVRFSCRGDTTEVVLQQELDGLGARSRRELDLALEDSAIGARGSIQLSVRSPGTQQWLQRDTLLRVPVFKMGKIELVEAPLLVDGYIHASSVQVELHALRDALGLSAFDPLVTADAAHYRFAPPPAFGSKTEFTIGVAKSVEPANGARVFVVAGQTSSEESEQQAVLEGCSILLHELESW